jgi:hypothetical protein
VECSCEYISLAPGDSRPRVGDGRRIKTSFLKRIRILRNITWGHGCGRIFDRIEESENEHGIWNVECKASLYTGVNEGKGWRKKQSGINLIGGRIGQMEHGWNFDSRTNYV